VIRSERIYEHVDHVLPDPSAKRLNVIYVFIDALRPDHLGVYGYARNTSPNLDKLAARSSLFENAFTPAPNTFEALPKFTQGHTGTRIFVAGRRSWLAADTTRFCFLAVFQLCAVM
jgi:hypothetical protein